MIFDDRYSGMKESNDNRNNKKVVKLDKTEVAYRGGDASNFFTFMIVMTTIQFILYNVSSALSALSISKKLH